MSHAVEAKLAERLLAGDRRALARAISLVEDDAPAGQSLLSACFPHTGAALRIGITGAPGAGKSTLVDQLARAFREQQRKVGILAVDPTSPFSGGAILGDRIRMERHHADNGVYARSMATRGAMGGLARAAVDAAMLIEAGGFDRILIETVGVGQDEIDIVRLADITIVVLVPGMGDDVQSIKAGILEIADIFVVNKSDREGADRVEKELKAMQSFASSHGSWVPPVVRTVASTGQGTDGLVAALDNFIAWLSREEHLRHRREQQWGQRLTEMVRAALLRGLRAHALKPDELAEHARRIAARQEDPFVTAAQMVEAITGDTRR
ncbi:MAG TPA: methylmalonyl Co-A mutase-associated GTPase MeaB [Acidobacteriaceae bacterium]|jgi:LAO/AO transport system kinase|nr:methylmalonyl Co-A mutase-associated GTPase MeaB [Acidobacteriaceae bacterium]